MNAYHSLSICQRYAAAVTLASAIMLAGAGTIGAAQTVAAAEEESEGIISEDITESVTGETPAAIPDETKKDAVKTPNKVKEPAKKKIPKKDEFSVTADRITRSTDGTLVEAFGDVVIIYSGMRITGDKGSVNLKTGDGYVEGAMRYEDENADIEGDLVEFNTETKKGVFYNAKGGFGDSFFFTGEKIERVSRDRYLITRGACSTCPFENQSWRFDANHVDVTAQKYAHYTGVKFRANDIPVLYIPYMITPAKTKRATGFLVPKVGHSSVNGFMIRNDFFWAIADNMDATISHESMGRLGNKYLLEYRYVFPKETYGWLNYEYMQETDPDLAANRTLWKLDYNHRQTFPWKVQNIIRVDRASETNIDRQFGDNVQNRTRRYTDSYLTLRRLWSTRDINMTVRGQKSTQPDREDEVNSLPILKFTNQPEKLFGSPVYGRLQSSYTAYRTKATVGEETSPFDVDRIDIFPILSVPISVAPWLSLTPLAGYRATWYSNGIGENGEPLEESFSREYFTAGLSIVGPKFQRIFKTSSTTRPKLKHLIIPQIDWSYLPGLDVDGEDRRKVKILDGVDQASPRNGLLFKLTNKLLIKELIPPKKKNLETTAGKTTSAVMGKKIEEGDSVDAEEAAAAKIKKKKKTKKAESPKETTFEAVNFNISAAYDLNEARREIDPNNPEDKHRPWSNVLFDLDTRLFRWLLINYDAEYNIYEQRWDRDNLEIGFRYQDFFHFALDRSWEYPDKAWDTAYVEFGLPWNMRLDYSFIYNEEEDFINDSVLTLRRQMRCWALAVHWFKRRLNKTDLSGEEFFEDETKFMFSVSLTGVGDVLGSKRAPVARRKL